jgi:hypothetical protein
VGCASSGTKFESKFLGFTKNFLVRCGFCWSKALDFGFSKGAFALSKLLGHVAPWNELMSFINEACFILSIAS